MLGRIHNPALIEVLYLNPEMGTPPPPALRELAQALVDHRLSQNAVAKALGEIISPEPKS